MADLNIIDQFMTAFIRYIDSGFGLLGGDVHFLTTTLIGIDSTLAGLFWALGGEQDVIARFVRKVLYVGAFAFILSSFASLATIIFDSFAQAGITAGGGNLTAGDLLKPGHLAGIGFSAAWPLLDQASKMVGFTTFFDNVLTITILLFAWVIVIIAFFVMAVQMFVTIIEFKLTTLAGFVLVPFALWNRTSFLAERVLGNVVSSGLKVMVLAVIVGIGSGYFTTFTTALQSQEPNIAQAMSLVLASLTLLGLCIFGPSIASGLVAGAPQLGGGAALGTAAGAAGLAMVGAGVAGAAGGAALGAVQAGTRMGAAASTAYKLGQDASGSGSIGAGVKGMARAVGNASHDNLSATFGLRTAAAEGKAAAAQAFAGNAAGGPASGGDAGGVPGWARKMRSEQSARHHRQIAAQSLREGHSGGASATPDIDEKED